MKALLIVPIIAGLTLTACTQTEKDAAKATVQSIAAAGVDAACNNLSAIDMEFHSKVPNPNAAAQAVYNSGMATLVATCNSRPLSDPVNQQKAVLQAVNGILNVITQYAVSQL